MKKLFIALLIILAFAGTAFYFGWTSFAVPLGNYGVLNTKTGGVSQNVIENGRFSWNWERLIPTNARLTVFSDKARIVRFSISGTLPSAELYANVAGGKPNFAWKIEGSVSARINPARLPELVKKGVSDQNGLEQWIDSRVSALVESALNKALSLAISGELSEAGHIPDARALAEEIRSNLVDASEGDFIAADTHIETLSLPDADLYRLAKKTYMAYLEAKSREFSDAAAREATYAATDQYTLDRYEKWGALLTRYPILIDFITVSNGNPEAALKKVRAFSGQESE